MRKRGVSKTNAPVDVRSIRTLLNKMAPDATDDQVKKALGIITRAVAVYRASAPTYPHPLRPAAGFKKFRRALAKLGKSSHGSALSDEPFAALPPGRMKEVLARTHALKLAVLPGWAAKLMLARHAVLNDLIGIGEVETTGIAGGLLDAAIRPADHEADLAGRTYLAIFRGLMIQPSLSPLGLDEDAMGKGYNYARLLRLALKEAGAEVPSNLFRLMKVGEERAGWMLEPTVVFPDGRSVSDFDAFLGSEPDWFHEPES